MYLLKFWYYNYYYLKMLILNLINRYFLKFIYENLPFFFYMFFFLRFKLINILGSEKYYGCFNFLLFYVDKLRKIWFFIVNVLVAKSLLSPYIKPYFYELTESVQYFRDNDCDTFKVFYKYIYYNHFAM